MVDALEARVVRLFPYLGNVDDPALARRDRCHPTRSGGRRWSRQSARWEAEDAALVIEAALLEALRYQHDHRRLIVLAGTNEVALGTPPEALTLAHLPAGTTRVWYPDPPLGREELDRLQPAERGSVARSHIDDAAQRTCPLETAAGNTDGSGVAVECAGH